MNQNPSSESGVPSFDPAGIEQRIGRTSNGLSDTSGLTEDDVLALGRRKRMAEAARTRLDGLSTRSRGAVESSRARVTPATEATWLRLQQSRDQLQQQRANQTMPMRSIVIALAALITTLVVVALLRSRRQTDEEYLLTMGDLQLTDDLLLEADMELPLQLTTDGGEFVADATL